MSPNSAAFALSFACGAFLYLLWDVLYCMRRVFFRGVFTNMLLDIVWWTAAALSVTWYTSLTNHFQLRLFVLSGIAGGAALYRLLFSRAVRRVFLFVFDIILKIIKFIFKILLTPAVFLYTILLGVVLRRKGASEKTSAAPRRSQTAFKKGVAGHFNDKT